ncbi:hypothetical protein CXF85_08685 [Colwellia sp. 75C3]|uniref:hypothetical protein n=1 Tax=Colwellia sp. 75C3 TaxID=888425 RepID=UPI000C332F82|nr:hypothetical protein [Colwellia sp. 75C3]PKG84387.1 hypothetical protein CXF85_08685 [Colwellia sp. 75C3]
MTIVEKLEVYKDKSILYQGGESFEFIEGPQSKAAKQRYAQIKKSLEEGFFKSFILQCLAKPEFDFELDAEIQKELDELIESITSEVGRAIVALCVMQLVLKSINSEQSIRLHKGGSGGSNFSWSEGISMRVLDKNFITPTLREFDLIKLNRDGFMMTRTLAENYPYCSLYKAAIRGKKDSWTCIVNKLESGELNAKHALEYSIKKLNNNTKKFNDLTTACINKLDEKKSYFSNKKNSLAFITNLVSNTDYAARIFEVSMHALFQVLSEKNCFEGELKALSQMRSANKKHKNIGDIEIVSTTNDRMVFESWDAKFGKAYLRDELDELGDKLELQPMAQLVGFVVDSEPMLSKDVVQKQEELANVFNVEVKILSFEQWVDITFERVSEYISEADLSNEWINNLVLSLGQRKRKFAPIDEPCDTWVKEITAELNKL